MRAVIFDLDGTLFDCSARVHHVKGAHRNWDAFFAGIPNDPLVEHIAYMLDSFSDGAIILCTGRPEEYRQPTLDKLAEHDIEFTELYMRNTGDYRADHIIKKELLDEMIAAGYEPWFAIDDRQSIVDMWRANGIPTLQCAPHIPDIPTTAVLTLMIGPSGAGKSHWLATNDAALGFGIGPSHIIASDTVRSDICGDFRDQTKNNEVFEAVHAVAKTRLQHGLPTVIDATHLHRKDRLNSALLVPKTVPVRYVIIDRPMVEKKKTAGWRAELPFDLLAKHQQTFDMQLKDILAGDNLPNVTVLDRRIK